MVRTVALAGVALATASGLMQLRSSDFAAGGSLPRQLMATQCGGQNHSPALTWSGAPKGTRSFALVVHDPDAPIPGGFYHWVVYNLPAGTHSLSASAQLSTNQLGETSAGNVGYYGPCPPPGPAHHYVFTLYALDVARIASHSPPRGAQLEQEIGGHIIARTALLGTASRP
jgi:Raf kinase inhibitor-like YbhB/YbcL family protein